MTIKCNACAGHCLGKQKHTSCYKPVIAIAGLSCETSTFTNARTESNAFHPLRGHDIVDDHRFLHRGTNLGDAADWKGALTAYALPGGIVTRCAFESLTKEILVRLEQVVSEFRIDGLWFDIHGAMSVEGVEDCEAELLRRIRTVIGPEVAVSASMDLHGNVSQALMEQTDLITCYRSAPHEDVDETKERACRNLVGLLNDRYRHASDCDVRAPWPVKAWIPVPVLLPGEQTSTRQEPAKSIYAKVSEIATQKGVIDASVWVGYAWADEPRSHASIVVTGWNKCAVVKGAEQLSRLYWTSREDFHFSAPVGAFEECFDQATMSTDRPYFISDSGDNPTAGGSGDTTWSLRRLIYLLKNRVGESSSKSNFIYASLPSPKAVEAITKAGIGATITVSIDAGIDDDTSSPIQLTGTVSAIKNGDPDAETEVVLTMDSLAISVILTKLRKPYHYEHDFTDLGLDVGNEDTDAIVIVKIGYLEPDLFSLAKDWMLALTPGGVDQDLLRLGHKHIIRPMYPFDKDFEKAPNLTARIVRR